MQICRLLIVCVAALLFCSCEYAKPAKTSEEKGAEPNQSAQSDALQKRQKPAYVTAKPADDQSLTGINGGQRFTFDPPDFAGEWIQDTESDLVRFFVVDLNGSKNVTVDAESFCIKASDNLLFSLDPDNLDASGSHSFSLDDRNLALAMNSAVEVIMTLDDKTYRAKLNDPEQEASDEKTKVDE